MKVLIVTDQRFIKKDGRYFTEKVFKNNIERYKELFGDVSVYAKTGKSTFRSSEEVTGVNVFLGGRNLDIYTGKNLATFRKIVTDYDLLILRIPSIMAHQIGKIAKRKRVPYMVVGVGCVFDALWNHGLIGKLIAPIEFLRMRDVAKNASYATYVTQKFLQSRYPCLAKSVGVSDVTIRPTDDSVLAGRLAKIESMDLNAVTFMTAAALNVRYKGQQYVIKAIKLLKKRGIYARYYVAGTGDGKYLRDTAKKYGVADQVIILGAVPHEKIFELLDQTDIYIQPSLQEGLPRSVVEAMSRGCPCIGTKTGGIPELISPECVVERRSSRDIARAVESILNIEKLKLLAKTNYAESQNYSEELLAEHRRAYFDYVINDLRDCNKHGG